MGLQCALGRVKLEKRLHTSPESSDYSTEKEVLGLRYLACSLEERVALILGKHISMVPQASCTLKSTNHWSASRAL